MREIATGRLASRVWPASPHFVQASDGTIYLHAVAIASRVVISFQVTIKGLLGEGNLRQATSDLVCAPAYPFLHPSNIIIALRVSKVVPGVDISLKVSVEGLMPKGSPHISYLLYVLFRFPSFFKREK